MTSRNPRSRPGTRGPCRPGLTRAHTLRQAKAAAIVRERTREEPVRDVGPCPPRRPRTGLSKLGPAPADPKRIDFSKPGLTKAMLARMQHAQKLRAEEEKKRMQEEAAASRRPRRTGAPIGGNARAGRPARHWQPEGALQEAAMRSPTVRKMMQNRAKGVSGGRAGIPGPSGVQRRRLPTARIPKATAEAANRSIQVIQETLDEQDIVESVAVNNKLQDLQQARREFVMAVANVSGNAVNMADEIAPPFSPSSPPGSPLAYMPGPLPSESPPRYLHKIDIDDPFYQVEYERCHPTVESAREFLRRTQAVQSEREAQRRIDEEFARAAARIEDDDLRFDTPFNQDIMEGDISFEEDEDETIIPCVSRIKASMPPIPQRDDSYPYRSVDINDLERFFDTTNYPPVASTFAPPPGREHVHPDLWELEDPWYRECPQPEVPDLIEFDLMEF